MTTLVGVQGNGWCVLGSESRASLDTGRLIEAASPKIVETNGILIAGAGSGRGSNLVHHGWKPARPRANQDTDEWMTMQFIPQMRHMFIDAGYDMKEDGDVAEHDSSFLIVVRGVIYPVFEDYSWDRDTSGIYYSGSGGDIALGAMEALLGEYQYLEAEGAESVVRNAISIASKWDIHTAQPIIVMTQYE